MAALRNILGVSCHYHDSAAAVLKDGRLVSASQEERFDREKYSPGFPIQAINDCLQRAELTPLDIDAIAFHEKPFLKLSRVLLGHVASWPFSFPSFAATMPSWLEDRLSLPLTFREQLGYEGPVYFVKHHMSHAAASYYCSPFEEAGILTVDGIGEFASASWGRARGNRIHIERELRYPNSLGLLYSIVCTYLGFRVFSGEGKVMALAALGEPDYVGHFEKCLDLRPDGSFGLDPHYFSLNRGKRMYGNEFVALFGEPRGEDEPLEQRHLDIAASLQAVTERVLVQMARHVHEQTGDTKLCAGGGVFLNVVANTKILEETPFEELFVLPAPGDAGAAVGAAAWVHHELGSQERIQPLQDAYLGPAYGQRPLRRALDIAGLEYQELEESELAEAVAARIADGRIVAWFQGGMEFGPRALGARSILADPRRATMKDDINNRIKHREPFRPYGISVLEEAAPSWFGLEHPSPYMLLIGRVKDELAEKIPSAVHVDGTCRIQTVDRSGQPPFYRAVIEAFDRLTGVPMIINTSFNVQEPIVCSPSDALETYLSSDMDCLVMGRFLVDKRGEPSPPG
jgi:carbamoyltransferase